MTWNVAMPERSEPQIPFFLTLSQVPPILAVLTTRLFGREAVIRAREDHGCFFWGSFNMEDPLPKPIGTLAILVIFALAIVILWSAVYLALLLRGATQ